MVTEKDFYQVISDELTSKNVDTALWTQAIAIAEGDASKTQAAYIRLRISELKKSASAQVIPPLGNSHTDIAENPVEVGLPRIRSELTKRIQAQGKASLYSTLSLHPDASDAVIASAIADYEARAKVGSVATSAEFKYAKETLGNPKLREQYDRKLIESISNSGTGQPRLYSYEPADNEYSWWMSRKTSVIIGVLSLTLIGYLALGFFREKGNHEIQKDTIDLNREVVHTIGDINQQKTQAAIDINNQNAERIQQQQFLQQSMYQDAQNQRQVIQQEQAERMKEQAEKMKEQREQQAESMRAQREQRYWACIDQQLSLPKVTSADAYARCAPFH